KVVSAKGFHCSVKEGWRTADGELRIEGRKDLTVVPEFNDRLGNSVTDDPNDCTVVLFDPSKRGTYDVTLSFGKPRGGARLDEKVLSRYALAFVGTVPLRTNNALRRMFTGLPEPLFVFANGEGDCKDLAAVLDRVKLVQGEPLLVDDVIRRSDN